MAQARRRIPYTMGAEPLAVDTRAAIKQLHPREELKLSESMRALYAQLLPTEESELRRQTLIKKLEGLFRERWPGHDIGVSVFGSTGNTLGTNDSDVDICITTSCKEIEHVCAIADLLARNGMERVVCVSSAKVPIVKVWDPELQVACDINVNNPIALENTALIKSYVAIDDRFRPLAMIVKYWAKRRVLNDAGKSTMSSVGFCTDYGESSRWHSQLVHVDLSGTELSANTEPTCAANVAKSTRTESQSPARCQYCFRPGFRQVSRLWPREPILARRATLPVLPLLWARV